MALAILSPGAVPEGDLLPEILVRRASGQAFVVFELAARVFNASFVLEQAFLAFGFF